MILDDGLILFDNRDAAQEVLKRLQENFKITIEEPGYLVVMEIILKEGANIRTPTNLH